MSLHRRDSQVEQCFQMQPQKYIPTACTTTHKGYFSFKKAQTKHFIWELTGKEMKKKQLKQTKPPKPNNPNPRTYACSS